PKARRPLVGRITQHRPNRGALPARDLLACRNTPIIEQARDRADTHARANIALVDHPDDVGFGVNDFISGGRFVALANVTIAVRRAAEYVDLTLAGAVALAAAGSFKDLCSLVFGDHARNCTSSWSSAVAACGAFTKTVSTPWRASSSI